MSIRSPEDAVHYAVSFTLIFGGLFAHMLGGELWKVGLVAVPIWLVSLVGGYVHLANRVGCATQE